MAALSPAASIERAGADFDVLFRAEASYVFQTLRRLGVHEGDLEDVLHEVFLTVHRRLGDYDTARPVRPWLFGIAANFALRYRSLARHRREIQAPIDERPDERPPVDEQMVAMQRRRLLHTALEALDEGQRTVFMLYDLDGVSMQAIAASLQIPLNTAYSRRRLALQHLDREVRRLKQTWGIE